MDEGDGNSRLRETIDWTLIWYRQIRSIRHGFRENFSHYLVLAIPLHVNGINRNKVFCPSPQCHIIITGLP
jgi:hypothetical protein